MMEVVGINNLPSQNQKPCFCWSLELGPAADGNSLYGS